MTGYCFMVDGGHMIDGKGPGKASVRTWIWCRPQTGKDEK